MHTAYLGIGSNIVNAAFMIASAIEALPSIKARVVNVSGIFQTQAPYLNMVAEVETESDYASLLAASKDMETAMGRKPSMKSRGIVPIDIDIVTFDGEIKRKRDFEADYFAEGYQKIVSQRHK